MILNAVQRAFSRDNTPPTSAEPEKAAVRKGGLKVVFHVKVGESLCCVASMSGRLAAATDAGDVVFIDGADGTRRARCDATDEPPNALAFTRDARYLISVCDDGCARVMGSNSGAVLFSHAVVEEPAAGKRPRYSMVRLVVLGSRVPTVQQESLSESAARFPCV